MENPSEQEPKSWQQRHAPTIIALVMATMLVLLIAFNA